TAGAGALEVGAAGGGGGGGEGGFGFGSRSVGIARYSVVTESFRSSSAARSVCQASVAHLTRIGNSETPENAASLPRPSASTSFPVTRSWKRSKRARTSSSVFPLTASVSIDADAVEIAQPAPVNDASFATPSSTRTHTVTRSPQSGLWPTA